eukprot:TRINITY_DN2396_c0_g2_i3.p1 TRINITY_DN2396_c0_g2~~TRINITY_DN2396_c0_g2_i3.p1  ORF type:complete len:174 (+),score=47.21 TRINITY_DN2396_c0_g2_i3:214-735(+)
MLQEASMQNTSAGAYFQDSPGASSEESSSYSIRAVRLLQTQYSIFSPTLVPFGYRRFSKVLAATDAVVGGAPVSEEARRKQFDEMTDSRGDKVTVRSLVFWWRQQTADRDDPEEVLEEMMALNEELQLGVIRMIETGQLDCAEEARREREVAQGELPYAQDDSGCSFSRLCSC